MAAVNRTPGQHRLFSLDFPRLDGGLNLSEVEDRLSPNESPDLRNLWWEDGCLQSRPGQQAVPIAADNGTSAAARAPAFAVTDIPFHGSHFLHLGARLYRWDGETDSQGRAVMYSRELGSAAWSVPQFRGTFFRFGDWLFYKNRGGFYRIAYSAASRTFSASRVDAEPYVPTIVLNANPETGGGDLYQPQNRLTDQVKVCYTAATYEQRGTVATGDGATDTYAIGGTLAEGVQSIAAVYVAGVEVPAGFYTADLEAGTVTLETPPEQGQLVAFQLRWNQPAYTLPVRDVTEVVEVKVDGRKLTEGTDYTVNLAYGLVEFATPPPVTDPPRANTVEITYRKDDSAARDARSAVMTCGIAAVYGTGQQMAIVLGGCPAQPNAVFWSGSTAVGLDASYWPMSAYNLLGDTEDAVTGFGRQYGELLVFKAYSVGKLGASVETIEGRDNLSLLYTQINDRIGCDLPHTIQLVGNNLIFCHTEGGIYRVRDASAALENGIQCLSGKINGSSQRPGLLYDLRTTERGAALTQRRARAFNDGQRFLLSVGTRVWVWDYSISTPDNPSWFLLDGFSDTAAWLRQDGDTCRLDTAGRLVRLAPGVYEDFGAAFQRVYQFPVQNFGSYDRLKDVLTVILSLRGEAPQAAEIIYTSDYQRRTDLTPIRARGTQSISPRDLTFRDLSVNNHAVTFRRRPMCRHVRNFALRLENHTAGTDLAILSAQVQGRFLGRDR